MTKNFRLVPKETGLMVIDVQEKIFSLVERSQEVFLALKKAIQGCQIIHLPIVVTEQYPQGLGETVIGLKEILGKDQRYLTKTTFSALGDTHISNEILEMEQKTWILIGIEAHVCVLQTAMDLIRAGKQVIVLNDAISSRSIFDYSTAIAEMRDCGARISSVETVLFELIADSKNPSFKAMSRLIK